MLGKIRIVILIFSSLYILLCLSCEKITLQDNPLSDADSVKFSRDIKPIFKACISCHDGFRFPDLKNNPFQSLKGGNYINIAKPNQSKLYLQLTTESLHTSKISPDQLKKILQWIKQGGKNN